MNKKIGGFITVLAKFHDFLFVNKRLPQVAEICICDSPLVS